MPVLLHGASLTDLSFMLEAFHDLQLTMIVFKCRIVDSGFALL
jgi:hypothetical protein